MKENLLSTINMVKEIEAMIKIQRDVIEKSLTDNQEVTDELTAVLLTLYNGLGQIQVQLFECTELAIERSTWFGWGEGLKKQIAGNFVMRNEEDQEVIDSTEFVRGNGDEIDYNQLPPYDEDDLPEIEEWEEDEDE